jgi:hypothetical protein
LVLCSNCEGLDGLESEVGHGWVGVLDFVSVAADWYQTTPCTVKLCNRMGEDLLPTGSVKVLWFRGVGHCGPGEDSLACFFLHLAFIVCSIVYILQYIGCCGCWPPGAVTKRYI